MPQCFALTLESRTIIWLSALRRMAVAVRVLMAAVVLGMALPAAAQTFETKAKQAYLVDAETGTVLFAKNENQPVPPASLAKLMTMEVVFNAIHLGRVTLEDQFPISEHAWRTGGAPSRTSSMFAKLNSSVALGDLIQGVIVQSANDACIAIAEGMAGSEANFAALMTQRARQIGLANSVFANASGLPDPGSHVTMRDLVVLSRHIQTTYPEFYHYYSQPEFTWNGIRQRNRNPLLNLGIGVDGMKTGYTDDSGYAIVASIKGADRRLILAMSGLASERERAEESRKMLEWGLRAFEKRPLFADGEIVGEASVYGGAQSSVPLKAAGPVNVFVPIIDADRLTARILYRWPLSAPIKAGARVGTLRVSIGDGLTQDTPLFAVEDVEKGSLTQQALSALQELLFSWI